MMKPTPYVTRRAHGKYPKGSPCMASRWNDLDLTLTFEDGGEITLGPRFYAEGLEEPRTLEQRGFYESIAAGIAREIDEEILGELLKTSQKE